MHRSALLAGCAAAAVYFKGLFSIEMAVNESSHGASSSPSPSCQADAPVSAENITGYRVSHLPLRFECVLDDGTTYASGEFPGWLTAVPVVLALISVLLAFGAWHVAQRGTRQEEFSPARPRGGGASGRRDRR
ncbi:hypothetical protein [Streptomyces sp. NPDC029674]|uniref:hypothetical protein n=1 Tax=Streptomyces sp. NPDC029674 TaxID=3365297 RepID=UPI00384DF4F6